MSVPQEAAPGMKSLEAAITRRIANRTGGVVRDVEVVAEVGRVEIRGRTESYYHKQLVIRETLAEVEDRKEMGPMTIDVKVVVNSSRAEIETP
jgi:hypothetical protein